MPQLKDVLASNFDLTGYVAISPDKPINEPQC